MVIAKDGELIETNMDEIEQRIVKIICDKNLHLERN